MILSLPTRSTLFPYTTLFRSTFGGLASDILEDRSDRRFPRLQGLGLLAGCPGYVSSMLGDGERRDEGDDPVLPIELPTAAATAAGAAELLAPPPRRAPSGCAPVTTMTSSTSGPMSPAYVRKGS